MTELDRLLVRIEADVRPLEQALERVGAGARDAGEAVSASLGARSLSGLESLTDELGAADSATRLLGQRLSSALDDGNASALALADSVGRVLGQVLDGSIKSWEDLGRVALSVVDDILRALSGTGKSSSGGGGIAGALASVLTGQSIGGGFGGPSTPGLSGLGFTIPGLASGGRVEAGGLYQVGEAGRELFVPELPGSVIPKLASDRLLSRARSAGSGGVQVHNTYNIDARGAQQGVGAEIAAALDARSARIRAEAVDQVFALMDRGGRYAKASGRR